MDGLSVNARAHLVWPVGDTQPWSDRRLSLQAGCPLSRLSRSGLGSAPVTHGLLEPCHASGSTRVTSKKDVSGRKRLHSRSRAHHRCIDVVSSWSVEVLAYKMGHDKPGGSARAPAGAKLSPRSSMLSAPKEVHGQKLRDSVSAFGNYAFKGSSVPDANSCLLVCL